MAEPKQPPPGVETTPVGLIVPLKEAAARLNKDPRTLVKAITSGELRGGAMPRPERLRWYVYADELPGEPGRATPPPVSSDEVDDLRAQVVALQETNRLLLAAQQELLDADAAGALRSERLQSAARLYMDALGQFMTPGHLGELARDL